MYKKMDPADIIGPVLWANIGPKLVFLPPCGLITQKLFSAMCIDLDPVNLIGLLFLANIGPKLAFLQL